MLQCYLNSTWDDTVVTSFLPFALIGDTDAEFVAPTFSAAADVQSDAAVFGWNGEYDPSYPTTAATNAAHQAADLAFLNTNKDEMIAANDSIRAQYGCDVGTGGGGGYTYGDADAAKVLTTATGAGTYQPVAMSAVQKGVAVGVSPAVGILVGIVDSAGTQHDYGTCSSAQAWAAAGIVHTSGTAAASGILTSAGSYATTGLLVDAATYHATGWWDGASYVASPDFPDVGNVRPPDTTNTVEGTLANLVATDAAYVTLENSRNNDNGTVAADIQTTKSVKIRNSTITGVLDVAAEREAAADAQLTTDRIEVQANTNYILVGHPILDQDGTLTLPANGAKILTTQTPFGIQGLEISGTYVAPVVAGYSEAAPPFGAGGATYGTLAAAKIRDATYGTLADESVLVAAGGTFDESTRNTDPGEANVADGVTYKILNISKEGTLEGGGGSPPAKPTLVVVDQEDGTGATATISGADSGTTNTVYVSDWPGSVFVSKGSRVGNGNVDLSLTTGPKWGFVKSVSAGGDTYSNMVQFRVTDGSDPNYLRCLDAAKAIIEGLGLMDGATAVTVERYKIPWTRGVQKPGVVICPEKERVVPVTNEADDLGYGVTIAMARVSNQDTESGLSTVLDWRNRIMRIFRTRAVAGMSDVFNVTVEPGSVFWEPAFLNQHDVSALTVRLFIREPGTAI